MLHVNNKDNDDYIEQDKSLASQDIWSICKAIVMIVVRLTWCYCLKGETFMFRETFSW